KCRDKRGLQRHDLLFNIHFLLPFFFLVCFLFWGKFVRPVSVDEIALQLWRRAPSASCENNRHRRVSALALRPISAGAVNESPARQARPARDRCRELEVSLPDLLETRAIERFLSADLYH